MESFNNSKFCWGSNRNNAYRDGSDKQNSRISCKFRYGKGRRKAQIFSESVATSEGIDCAFECDFGVMNR